MMEEEQETTLDIAQKFLPMEIICYILSYSTDYSDILNYLDDGDKLADIARDCVEVIRSKKPIVTNISSLLQLNKLRLVDKNILIKANEEDIIHFKSLRKDISCVIIVKDFSIAFHFIKQYISQSGYTGKIVFAYNDYQQKDYFTDEYNFVIMQGKKMFIPSINIGYVFNYINALPDDIEVMTTLYNNYPELDDLNVKVLNMFNGEIFTPYIMIKPLVKFLNEFDFDDEHRKYFKDLPAVIGINPMIIITFIVLHYMLNIGDDGSIGDIDEEVAKDLLALRNNIRSIDDMKDLDVFIGDIVSAFDDGILNYKLTLYFEYNAGMAVSGYALHDVVIPDKTTLDKFKSIEIMDIYLDEMTKYRIEY